MTNFFSFNTARPVLALLGLGLAGLAGCQSNLDGPATPTAGTADFKRYIAVGNSLTAGIEDGGLYLEGQQNSYPNILAGQFAQAGGGQFRQPLFTTAQANGAGYLRLAGFTATGSPITQNVTTNLAIRGLNSSGGVLYTKYLDPIDNLGVPSIRLADMHTANLGNIQPARAYNLVNFLPYFERITPDGSSQSYFQRIKAEAATATFFTMWLGNNDVFGYAVTGGASTTADNMITRTDTFNLKAVRMLNALTASGAKGVVSSIPDVTGLPFFTTVGGAARTALAAAKVPDAAPFVYTTGILAPGQANTRVAATIGNIRNASGSTGTLLLTLTASPYVGLYGQPTGKCWRDLYTLASGAPAKGAVFGGFLTALGVDTTKAFAQSSQNPFPSPFILDGTEQAAAITATTAFNNSLMAAANSKGLAFFDANAYFRSIAASGAVSNGVNNTSNYISGNLFSLDGVHPTPRGYALVANEIIKVINAKYGSTIQQVNANNYRGVLFP